MVAVALTPVTDALIVLTNGGKPSTALGVHGLTAALLVAAGLVLALGRVARPSAGRSRPAQAWRGPSVDVGAQGDVEAGAVACQTHQEDAGPFEGVGHLEPSCVEGPHVQALQKRRDTCLRLGAVAGEEHVQGLLF